MSRACPTCHAPLDPMDVKCRCGTALPEARDLRSDPSQPQCGLCGTAIELMAQSCPSCGAVGYPALRSRLGKKSRGAGDAFDL